MEKKARQNYENGNWAEVREESCVFFINFSHVVENFQIRNMNAQNKQNVLSLSHSSHTHAKHTHAFTNTHSGMPAINRERE